MMKAILRVPSLLPALLGFSAAGLFALLHPRVGILDVDAYAYVVGAYSIRQGKGYTDLFGASLYHWPPGFSLLLSVFTDPIAAAWVINLLALGLAVALAFELVRRLGWQTIAAVGIALAVGFGLFRDLALGAKPDDLTYAFFLAGVLLFNFPNHRARLTACFIWSALIPFKYIAVVFVPAALSADFLARIPADRLSWRERAGAVVFWLGGLGLVLAFNMLTTGTLVSSSHALSSAGGLLRNLADFGISVGRSLLSPWYGTILTPLVFVGFLVLLLLGLSCLSILRPTPQGRLDRYLGVLTLVFSGLLLLVRDFDAGVRLTGYGLLILATGFVPILRLSWLWLVYGAAMFVSASINLVAANSYGANDPRYQQLSLVIQPSLPPAPVLSNSFHLLDIHIHHASMPVDSVQGLQDGNSNYFFRVTLPAYDAIATTVIPMDEPGSGWCIAAEVEGGKLYRRCP